MRLLNHDRRMRKVQLKIISDPETAPVYMVEDHLMQLVLNLVLNSLDAMPDGGDLRIEIRSVGQDVALRIHDSGTGMARETARRCKEPLFTTKAPNKGTGLGLSICVDILDAVNGKLELHSTSRRGTTAVVTIPASVDGQKEPIMMASLDEGRSPRGPAPEQVSRKVESPRA